MSTRPEPVHLAGYSTYDEGPKLTTPGKGRVVIDISSEDEDAHMTDNDDVEDSDGDSKSSFSSLSELSSLNDLDELARPGSHAASDTEDSDIDNNGMFTFTEGEHWKIKTHRNRVKEVQLVCIIFILYLRQW